MAKSFPCFLVAEILITLILTFYNYIYLLVANRVRSDLWACITHVEWYITEKQIFYSSRFQDLIQQ